MKRLLILFLFFIPFTAIADQITVSEVKYSDGETELEGYLAMPTDIEGNIPGVLVVHEWWGHNEYARKRADMLARLGYAALAVDMYGDGKTADHPSKAKEFSSQVSSTHGLMEKRFGAALKFLSDREKVDADRIAAIGYCFGGGTVLEMARRGLPLEGVVSFHGSLGTENPAEEDVITSEVLVFNGEADPFVPREQVEAFRQEMESAEVDYELIEYPGVRHSFTNPQADEYGEKFDLPLQYDKAADRDSWLKTKEFLEKVLS